MSYITVNPLEVYSVSAVHVGVDPLSVDPTGAHPAAVSSVSCGP